MLNKQYQPVINIKNFTDCLEYISPEQTGLHRDLDYRTDFYSLGVVFYQMITGKLPFENYDHSKLIYSHIAKTPMLPHEVNSLIPLVISQIIMKMLAKSADDRYQSCFGIKMDLQRCLDSLRTHDKVDNFEICKHDVYSTFRISQKLYGREKDISVLLETFEEVTTGTVQSNILYVSGFSGLGKTSLINEVQKPLMRDKGYFISGKFDQFKRNIPYFSLIQAFKQLIAIILTESDEQIQYWRSSLQKKLSLSGKVITDVIPDVELIIGPQPPVAELGPSENENRFKRIMSDFIGVFSSKAHPLSIFLDDLQWADISTLDLLEDILAGDTQYLLIICAYRDNEVGNTHPLALSMKRLEKKKNAKKIALQPLTLCHVNQLIADTFNKRVEHCRELAQLVLHKTSGNPFFVVMFLTNLSHDRLIKFDNVDGQWKWNMNELYQRNLTDNVVEMMRQRIQKLEPGTQRILSLAASIGSKFDLDILSVAFQKSFSSTALELWPAVKDGLVLQFGDETSPAALLANLDANQNIQFSFLHDRVQQAAYELVRESERNNVHLVIGRLLLEKLTQHQQEEALFDILNHFKIAIDLLIDMDERAKIAELFLRASQRAKECSAYDPAFDFASCGMKLLPQDAWTSYYRLMLKLNEQLVESEYLRRNFEEAEKLYDAIIEKCVSVNDKVGINIIKVNQYEVQQRYADAYRVLTDCLSFFGIHFPDTVEGVHQELLEELEEVDRNISNRNISDFIDAPEMKDPNHLLIFRLLVWLYTPVYCLGFQNGELLCLTCARACNFTLKHGNCSHSVIAYINFLVCADIPGREKQSVDLGLLGLKCLDIYPNESQKCRAYFTFGTSSHYTQHLEQAIPYLDSCMDLAIQYGDFSYSSYAAHHMINYRYFRGVKLDEIQRLYERNMPYIHKINDFIYHYAIGVTMPVRCHCLIPEPILEEEYLAYNRNDYINVGGYYSGKVQSSYWESNSIEKLVYYSDRFFDDYPDSMVGYYTRFEVIFLSAMGYMDAFMSGIPVDSARKYLDRIDFAIRLFDKFSVLCPANNEHKLLLLKAEYSLMNSNEMDAVMYYEKARVAAFRDKFLQYEALANELMGKLWLRKGMMSYAQKHIQDAFELYREWGSVMKVKQLGRNYSAILKKDSLATDDDYMLLSGSKDIFEDGLVDDRDDYFTNSRDLLTVMKAAKNISMDLSLDQFLDNMMRLVIESSGAQRGVFMLADSNDDLLVVADGNVESVYIDSLRALPLSSCTNYPLSIINYVARTKETIIMGDKSPSVLFAKDPYVVFNGVKSILCAPIIKHNDFKGVIYLEQKLLGNAFSAQQAKITSILAAQISILLENVKFSQLLDSERKYRVLSSELAGIKKRLEEYIDVLCHELRNPVNAILGNTEILMENQSTDASFQDGVNAITLSAYHLKDIVDSVLNLSMIEHQSIKLQSILFEPAEVIDQVAQMFKGQLQGKSIELISEISSTLQNKVVSGDPYRYKEILINLLSNAIKFSDEGAIIVSCSCTPGQNPNTTTLITSVQDSGIGMTEEEQRRLFKPFSQATRGTFKQFGGAGLGLKICKDLVQAFGGSIGVESSKDKGSKFYFYITLQIPSREEIREYYESHDHPEVNNFKENEQLEQLTQLIQVPPIVPGKRILIAEDNPINAKLLMKILHLADHRCDVATNGMEAITMVSKTNYDLVLMDIEMPIMSGLEATKAIRRKEQKDQSAPVPIIGVSANARQQFREEAILSGMQSYITKPYLKQDIFDVVSRWAR